MGGRYHLTRNVSEGIVIMKYPAMKNKNPLKSLTLWGLLVILLSDKFGLSEVEITSILDSIFDYLEVIIEALGGLMIAIGRLRSNTKLSFKKN